MHLKYSNRKLNNSKFETEIVNLKNVWLFEMILDMTRHNFLRFVQSKYLEFMNF